MKVSIIIPCRNEANYIENFLESLLANDYPLKDLEVLIVDGMSDDGTRDIIKKFMSNHKFINLLDNEKKITPTALNIGIANAKGDVIIRMDVHAKYPKNYISGLVSTLAETGADNVGGVCVTLPGKDTILARAIAIAVSHPFGVGNSYFRIGVTEPRWVDTVPFGCYRKEVFEKIGVFDEELIRNQDDEFNLRLIKNGGKILLVPNITSHYYARDSLQKVWKMYYQYGYFKPLVIRKIGGVFTLRQLVPGAFVTTLGLLTLLAIKSKLASLLLLVLLVTYVTANLFVSWLTVARTKAFPAFTLPLIFPVIHFAYGIGFLKGILDFWLFRKDRSGTVQNIGLSR